MQANNNPSSLPRLCLQILVAEDSLASQTLMARMLGQMGHTVTCVNNGDLALTRLTEEHFDLIFMDTHMPVMNGATATRTIRSREDLAGGHVPIIAMSIHTMQMDRKRCLAAGMDRYISKPVNTTELQAVLQAFSDPDSVQQTSAPQNWNRTVTMERAGGDEKALSELISVFVLAKPSLLADMNRALTDRQGELLEHTALKLAEELSYLGAMELCRTARKLALLGRHGNFSQATELVLALQSRLSEMDATMARPEL